jgi:lysylphosphatidylglycerol synthetase-like protein (DUF2156 family)
MNTCVIIILYTLLFSFLEIGLIKNSHTLQDTLDSETARHQNDMEDFFQEMKDSSSLKESLSMFSNPEGGKTIVEFDSLTKSKYLESYQGYLNNNMMNYQHSQKVFKWQLTSSKLIFITVIILVMAGIVFSGLQFKKGTSDSRTELEFSKDGFKVSSSILGVIILVISLVFFYLYLVYVYPIEKVF